VSQGWPNVGFQDWSEDLTFTVGDLCDRCSLSVAQLLLLRVCKLHWIDETISELKLEIEVRDDLFGSVLEAAGGSNVAIDSAHDDICGILHCLMEFGHL
jgi:hypothetical protein